MSDSGYTTNDIAMKYLRHYIDHSDSGPDADWKIMLMDNHGSHVTPEFIELANENHIRPFPMIPHLTHCMQPLDVGVFHPMKHWHDMAIQDALSEFNIEYTMARFLNDLTKIRDNTFKKNTIRHVFKKSGMWPLNPDKCIEQLRKFNPDENKKRRAESDEIPLPYLPRTNPVNPMEVVKGFKEWQQKIQRGMIWSDPARQEEFEQFGTSMEVSCTKAAVAQGELCIYQARREEQMSHATSRKKFKKGVVIGQGLDTGHARKIKQAKLKEEEETEAKRVRNNWLKIWRGDRDREIAKGKIARQKEKNRRKLVKEYIMRREPVPEDLMIPIPDSFKIWASTDAESLARQAKKQKPRTTPHEQPEDVTLITESTRPPPLLHQQDMIMFDDDSDTGSRFHDGLEQNSDSESDVEDE
jgi:hypothetical protein